MLHVDSTRLLSASPAREQPGSIVVAAAQTALAPIADISSAQLPALRPRPPGGSPWLTPFLTTLVVVMGVALFVQHISNAQAKALANSSAPTEPSQSSMAMKPSPITASTVEETPYPFAQFVKVSGVRMVMDLNRRAQIQYLVVNHSDTALVNIGLKIAVRPGATTAGREPLFTVSARVPMLGPHESKEIRTDLDSDLRAEVQVTSQQ